jgi:hypothetical protein
MKKTELARSVFFVLFACVVCSVVVLAGVLYGFIFIPWFGL